MIITFFGIIVFQFVVRIAVKEIIEKSMKAVLKIRECGIVMLGFSYNAIPTRHEVPRKPYL